MCCRDSGWRRPLWGPDQDGRHDGGQQGRQHRRQRGLPTSRALADGPRDPLPAVEPCIPLSAFVSAGEHPLRSQPLTRRPGRVCERAVSRCECGTGLPVSVTWYGSGPLTAASPRCERVVSRCEHRTGLPVSVMWYSGEPLTPEAVAVSDFVSGDGSAGGGERTADAASRQISRPAAGGGRRVRRPAGTATARHRRGDAYRSEDIGWRSGHGRAPSMPCDADCWPPCRRQDTDLHMSTTIVDDIARVLLPMSTTIIDVIAGVSLASDNGTYRCHKHLSQCAARCHSRVMRHATGLDEMSITRWRATGSCWRATPTVVTPTVTPRSVNEDHRLTSSRGWA